MNKEQMLKELRTNEAMKKGYMGLEGHLAVIAKRLGKPIFRQGNLSFDQNYLDDPFDLHDEDEMPTLDEDANSYEIGLQFDGLTSGINMTISVNFYLQEIKCVFEGNVVYHEISGELEGYAPDAIWESKIDKLTTLAKTIERKQKPKERQQLIEATNKKKTEILEHLRKKWGLN